MEKEYLREQLSEREKELSVLNLSSAIMTSSLDIQAIFDSFVRELRKVVDVSWAAVALIEDSDLYFLALSPKAGSVWKVGERIPIKGTATEWVVTHKKAMVESDLSQQSQFVTGESHLKQQVRSIAYLPLIAKGRAIGSLTVASRQPNAYSRRHMMLLEQLASQVALPIDNTRLYAEVAEKARIDELTGLLNRRSLDEGMVNEVNRNSRYGGVFSIIILDVDSLKTVNDNYGHLAGDELLRQIGSIIKKAIRGADQAFRYGGDEFAILLPNTSIDAASQVAERVRKQVASEVMAGDIPVTASLGLASWPANGRGANEVMAAADAALYHAKRSGGNRSHCAGNLQ
jgi:diguanylate cyclase (GGDEF)-like protein